MSNSEAAPESDRTIDSAFVRALTAFISHEVAGVDDLIAGDADLLLTGLVDSFGVVMIVGWIEANLGVVVHPGDVVLENFQTIDAMVSLLRKR